MSRREDFDNALWSDPDFLALSPEARMTYIWSWTNPRCGMAGIYKVAPASAALEIGYSVDVVLSSLSELAVADFAHYERNVLWVRTRARKLRTKSEQIAKSVRSDLQKIADDHPLKERFLQMYAAMPWLRAFLSEGQASLDGTSPEPQPNPPEQPPSGSLNRASTEPHVRFPGNGTGKGSGSGAVEVEDDARDRPDVARICDLLASRIVDNDPKAKPRPDSKGWLTAARLLLDVDGRPVDEVVQVIEWCQSDPFWQANVLSMPKLREKFSSLALRMRNSRRPSSGGTGWTAEDMLRLGRESA